MNGERWFRVALSLLITTAVLILVGTFYAYYRSSLIHLSGNIDKDYFPAFGAFIGGILGVILNITSIILIYRTFRSQQAQANQTQLLIDRQISLSIKPELVVEDFNTFWNKKDRPERTGNDFFPPELENINLSLLNIGLEAAQCLSYKFEYDVVLLHNYVKKHIRKPPFKLLHKKGQLLVELQLIDPELIKKIGVNVMYINPKFGQESAFSSLLLPYKMNFAKIHMTIPFPYLFFYFYTYLYLFNGQQTFGSTLPDYPQCLFHLHYQDLEGRDYRKVFEMAFEFKGSAGELTPNGISEVELEIIAKDHRRLRPAGTYL